MDRQSETSGFGMPWGRVIAMAILVVAAIYASQHPHSFFYYLLKFIITPIP